MPVAVELVTSTLRPVPSVTGSSASPRRSRTRVSVFSSCGEVVGTANQRATVRSSDTNGSISGPSGVTAGPLTLAMPSVSPIPSVTATSWSSVVPSGSSATSSSWPLNPGPKPLANRS